MNAIIATMLLKAVLCGQVPPQLPPPPGLPPAPGEVQLPVAPLPGPQLPSAMQPPPLHTEGGVRSTLPPPRYHEDAKARFQEDGKPPPLVPVGPDLRGQPSALPGAGAVPAFRPDSQKPPPLKLIAPPVETPAVKPPPAVGALPPGILATPCLTVQHAGPTAVKAGQAFSYEIIVRNLASAAPASARLEEELPPGTRFLGAQPMPVPQGDRLVWNLENLPAGGERRIKIDVEASRDGEWRSQASLSVTIASSLVARVTGAPAQPPLTQPPPIQPAPVQPGPMVLITAPAPVPVGHPVTFPIRLSNTSGAVLTDAVLRVLLPPGLQHLQGDAIEGSLGDLAPGQSKELTLEVICLQTGKLPIDVTLLSRDKGVFNTQSAVSVTEQPTLALRQTGPIATPLGTEHEFKLEIVNRSSSEVRDVTVTDVLPEGLQYLSGDAGALYDPAARTVRWSVPGLAPGQTRQVTFRAAVRGAGPQLNRVSARWPGGQEALLYTIIRVGP